VPAVANAIAIVNFLNENAPHSASLAELSQSLGITKSHCHAILKTLCSAGWLKFEARHKTYLLSSGLIASGGSLLSSPVLVRIRERLVRLVAETGFSCVLTQPQADHTFVAIENFTPSRSMEVSHPVGFHFPKDAPAQSRSYLAWQRDSQIESWLASWEPHQYTSTSIVERQQLATEIRHTRERGYSRSVGEHYEGMMAFGLPIFDRDGDVLYIFCTIGFLPDIKPREAEVTRLMQTAAADIHRAILAKPPTGFPGW
jgi:IclR family acetate operon transcriptional repressor